MNIYGKKRAWTWAVLIIVGITFLAMVLYVNYLMDKIVEHERSKMTIWADAIHRRADLVAYTDNFFSQIAEDQERRAKLIGQAFMKIATSDIDDDITIYLDLIADNKTIPCILLDKNGCLTETNNLDSAELAAVKTPEGLKKVLAEGDYQKIPINYYEDNYIYLYYKESKIYTQLRSMLSDLLESFFSEIVNNAPSLPVIITDSTQSFVYTYGNIDSNLIRNSQLCKKVIEDMRSNNPPIKIALGANSYGYVLYQESYLMQTMRLFPIAQIIILILFACLAYFYIVRMLSLEQNQVWVGMSKETAHQLGTPISSLMAWTELLKEEEHIDKNVLMEIDKDISHLETIAQRFSKIGSISTLQVENLNVIITDFVAYFKNRTSSKVIFILNFPPYDIEVQLSKHLFEWVLENLCKNAVDAMNGAGTITITLHEDTKNVYIDVADTGKGIEPKAQKAIFKPGFTTKERGWGLGLTLTKRIINDYHKGKIELLNSVVGKGSSFRVTLKKSETKR